MTDPELTHGLDWHACPQRHVDDLQRRGQALPTEQNIAGWTTSAVLGAVNDSHHVSSDVLRCIIEINVGSYVPSTLTPGMDSALCQRFDFNLNIDHGSTQLLPFAVATLPNFWDEQ
ncbi:MAG: hypothetical protein HIU84_11185 [Acidobacteria bacterium]|nr:hypothetical protein [Acidobacteriota bacterium]